MSKVPRKKRAIEIAQEANKVPSGYGVARPSMRLPLEVMPEVVGRDSRKNGEIYQIGLAFEAQGYLLIYDILDRLGVRIISHIPGETIVIKCRHKTYEGKNQADLLLEILRDRIENWNYLTPGGFDDVDFERDI